MVALLSSIGVLVRRRLGSGGESAIVARFGLEFDQYPEDQLGYVELTFEDWMRAASLLLIWPDMPAFGFGISFVVDVFRYENCVCGCQKEEESREESRRSFVLSAVYCSSG